MRGFDWRGPIALVLAVGVIAVLVVAEILAATNPARTGGLTPEEASTASTVFGALVGAVAVYLGGREPPSPPPGRVGSSGAQPDREELVMAEPEPAPRRRRLLSRDESYTADDDVALDAPEPDDDPPPEAEQHGDPDHEGGPGDGGN